MVQEILAFFKIPWIAAFTAVFFWWFLTGLILFIVKKVDEINQRYLRGLQFQYVSSMIDVLDFALTTQKATKVLRKIK